jgi:hypothetical protein
VLITVMRASRRDMVCPLPGSLTFWFSNATAEITFSASVLVSVVRVLVVCVAEGGESQVLVREVD